MIMKQLPINTKCWKHNGPFVIYLPVPLGILHIPEKIIRQLKVFQQQSDAQVVHAPFSLH